ncbi:hypothetical protein N7536_005571 [Penicillium majusculum]|nr:hypothetical protein N7536_005571 [Penicillium majusculum]
MKYYSIHRNARGHVNLIVFAAAGSAKIRRWPRILAAEMLGHRSLPQSQQVRFQWTSSDNPKGNVRLLILSISSA